MTREEVDYAAVAVRTAIVEKFFGKAEPPDLHLESAGRMISIRDAGRSAQGTRDDLLATVRKTQTYDAFWDLLLSDGRSSAP